MPGRSKLSLQKRGKFQHPLKTSATDTPAEGGTPVIKQPHNWVDGKSTSGHRTACLLGDTSSSLLSEASIEEEDTLVPTKSLEMTSLMETATSSTLTIAGSSNTASFECILCGRRCESSQKKLLHVRQCARSLGISTSELALLTQEDSRLPKGGEEEGEEDFSVCQRKQVAEVGMENEGKRTVVTRKRRRAGKKEKLMPAEEEELQLAMAISASEAPPESLDSKGWPLGSKRRRGQKQLQALPPLASLSTSQVKRKIEHRIEQVLENKPLVSHGPHILATPELPQSKLAGRSAHVRRKVAAQGRMLPLPSGGSDGEESPPPPSGAGDKCIDERNADGGGRADQNSTDPAVVIVSSGEESPRLVDTDSQPQLHAAVGASDQPSPPQDICQLWHLSSYFEMEDTEKFYVQCLKDHIPPVVQEGEGRPSLAEVEGLEKAWQAEQAYAGSVEGGGAELSGRGLERKDTGVQTDREQDRNSAEVVSAGSVVKLSADLKRLLGDTLFADTEVKLSDGESVCAHAAVLAARWPQFRETAIALLGASFPHRYTVTLPQCEPHFVKALLHYIYTGEVQGEEGLGSAELVASIETFLTSTTQLNLQVLAPVGGESPGESLGGGATITTSLAAVDSGGTPVGGGALEEGGVSKVGGVSEVGAVSEEGGALVPLEVHTPEHNEDHWPGETKENLHHGEVPDNDAGSFSEDHTSKSQPTDAHNDMSSFSLDVDIPVSTFFLEHTNPTEDTSCVGTSRMAASGSDTSVSAVQQGEPHGGHFEPMDAVSSNENVMVSEAACCIPLTAGSCNRALSLIEYEPQQGPLSGSVTPEYSNTIESFNCDFAEEAFLQSDVDVTDGSDREGDSDSTESVGDNDSDGDGACSSYLDLFGGVEEVGGLLECPKMERLVTPLRDRAASLHSDPNATPSVGMTTLPLTPTHSLRQKAPDASKNKCSPCSSKQRLPSSQLPWSGDSPQVYNGTSSPTQSFHELASHHSALLSAERPYPTPTEGGSIQKGVFRPPLPPTTPAPQTPRRAIPAPIPAPADAGSSGFVSGPITPMPDYVSMATPWLKSQLKKYGVRPLTKKRMIAKLIEIYEYLHPVVDEDGGIVVQSAPEVDKKGKAKDGQAKGKERRGPPCACQQSSERESDNVEERVCQYIRDNKDLYLDVVTYKPLFFTDLHQRLKTAGITISKPALMDFLDKQCITFTLPRSGKTTRS